MLPFYKMMRHVLEEEYRRALVENLFHQTVGMIISNDQKNLNQRRYPEVTLLPATRGRKEVAYVALPIFRLSQYDVAKLTKLNHNVISDSRHKKMFLCLSTID